MRQLDLQADIPKTLSTLPPKPFRQIVAKIFELLNHPTPHDAQLLKGYPYYRADVGEYRVIYDFDADVVRIILIDKRNDDQVYKKLKRKK
jgi:mRNA interferase RelE/StbE